MMKIRKPRRQSGAATLYAVISVLLIITFTLVGISVFTRANVIEVIGAVRYSQNEIIEASGFELGDNLLFLDTDIAKTRIQTLLPHISEVEISPVFPDTISINVTESIPIATVRHRNGILVIDSSARVVEILTNEEQIPVSLIEIRGFTPSGADLGSRLRVELAARTQLQYLEDMLKAIEQEGFENYVTYIDISNIANITFDYTERFRVILDSPSRIAQNMGLLPGAIERGERDGSIAFGVRGTIRVSDAEGVFRFEADR